LVEGDEESGGLSYSNTFGVMTLKILAKITGFFFQRSVPGRLWLLLSADFQGKLIVRQRPAGESCGGIYIRAWIPFVGCCVSFALGSALGKPVLLARFGAYYGLAWVFGSLCLEQK
jgi:hypothetical protein